MIVKFVVDKPDIDMVKVVEVLVLFVSLKLRVVDCPGATGSGFWLN